MCALAPPRRAAGFTLLELLIGLTILGITLALGVPSMSAWMRANRAASAMELYAEGFRLARQQALGHNGASRIVLTANANNGQMDWQVDICFPTPALPCNAGSGSWSSTSAPADNDPEGAAGFKSVFRAADALPRSDVLRPTLQPSGAFAVYFTPIGWVDSAVAPSLTRIQLDPAGAYLGQVRASALVIGLAGAAAKCDPTVGLSASDSRACP